MGRLLLLTMVVLAVAAAEAMRLDPDLSGLPREWHYVVTLDGRRLGRARLSLSREGDHLVESTTLQLLASVDGTPRPFDLELRHEFDAQPPHALRRARRTVNGRETCVDGKGLDFRLADLETPRLWLARGAEGSIQVRRLAFETARVETIPCAADGRFDGARLTVESGGDAAGRLLAATYDNGIHWQLAAREEAEREILPEDWRARTRVSIDRNLGAPMALRMLELEVEGEGEIPDGARQSVVQSDLREGGRRIVRLGARHGVAQPAGDAAEFLVASGPELSSLAARALGDATTVRAQVERLTAFVSVFVEEDAASHPATLKELIHDPRGDCTERARLFVALARAAKIPAREVRGLVYLGDGARAFGAHIWCEVAIDGVWLPVDPSWNETEISASHITLRAFADAAGLRFKVRKLEQG